MRALRVLIPPSAEEVTPAEVCAVRERLGLERAAFATLFGVSLNAVIRWETGQRHVGSPRMWRWAVQAIEQAVAVAARDHVADASASQAV